jgi:hypothetical protein
MTQIRLDAATVAKIQDVAGPVTFCDEAGNPVSIARLTPADTGEPRLTPEEVRTILANPVRYTLAEVWDHIHRGEKM